MDKQIEAFTDGAKLCVAVGAYRQYLEDNSKDADNDPMIKKALVLFRRVIPDIDEVMANVIGPIAESPTGSVINPLYHRAMSGGSGINRLIKMSEFFHKFFFWIKNHASIRKDTFTSKRAYRSAYMLSQIAAEESTISKLNLLSAVPSSSFRVVTKWIRAVAELVGAPLSSTEALMADSEEGADVAEKINEVNGKLEVVDPVSEDAAELQAEKKELTEKLENIAESSPKPDVVISTAMAKMTEKPVGSAIAKEWKLNDEQTDVLLAEGKLLIAAGAGSGKTQTLSAKIAHLVKEKGYDPSQILATSFTKKASDELADRIERKFNVSGVNVGTTHSVCRQILGEFRPDLAKPMQAATSGKCKTIMRIAYGQIKMGKSKPAWSGWKGASEDDLDVEKELQEIGAKLAYPTRSAPRGAAKSPYYNSPAGQWFNLGAEPEDSAGKPYTLGILARVSEIFQSKGINGQSAWDKYKDDKGSPYYFGAALLGAYEWLKSNDPQYGPALDFNDWLTETVKLFKVKPEALASLQRRFKVLLVDEAQDLNTVQRELFGMLGDKADTTAYIGDDAQAIFEFRGATPQEFVSMKDKGFKIKTMTTNYRSGKNIVESANRLIAHNGERQIKKVCNAVPERGEGTISVQQTESHADSAAFTADEIGRELDAVKVARESGVEISHAASCDDFGILVRNNSERDEFEIALISKGIPYRSRGAGYFGKPTVKTIISWMRICAPGSDSEINEAVLDAVAKPKFFLGKAFADDLTRQCPKGKNFLTWLLEGGNPYSGSGKAGERNVNNFAKALEKIYSLKDQSSGEILREILNIQGSDGTMMDALVETASESTEEDSDEVADDEATQKEKLKEAAMAPVNPLMRMTDLNNTPEKFIAFITKMKKANEKVMKNETGDDGKTIKQEPAVMIDTIHQWKGLEKKHCYVSMAGGVFPNFRDQQASDSGVVEALDSDRRLAYVAITRGQDSVTILSPKKNVYGKEARRSQFIDEACIKPRGKTEKTSSEQWLVEHRVRWAGTGKSFAEILAANLRGESLDGDQDE